MASFICSRGDDRLSAYVVSCSPGSGTWRRWSVRDKRSAHVFKSCWRYAEHRPPHARSRARLLRGAPPVASARAQQGRLLSGSCEDVVGQPAAAAGNEGADWGVAVERGQVRPRAPFAWRQRARSWTMAAACCLMAGTTPRKGPAWELCRSPPPSPLPTSPRPPSRRGRPPAAAAVTARPSNRTPPPSLEMPARHTPLRCGRTQLHARGAVSEGAPALRPGSCGSVWATPPVHRERLSVSRWASNIMPGSEERAEAPQVGRRCLDGVGCGRRGGAGA